LTADDREGDSARTTVASKLGTQTKIFYKNEILAKNRLRIFNVLGIYKH
jgi:hypothetical protein